MGSWAVRLFFVLACANMAASITLDDCPSNLPRDRYLRAFGTSCYHFVTSHERSFAAAERECEARRGHLVIVRNAQVQQFLYNTLKNDFHYNGAVWLGLTDQKSEGQYVWVDGSRATYTHWASGQPGLLGSLEDCAAMEMSAGGAWHDYPCQGIFFFSSDHVFVCEYPAIIRTTTPTTPIPTTGQPTTPQSATTPEPAIETTAPPQPTVTPQSTATPQPMTPAPTAMPAAATTGCPPFQCQLECGLAGYVISDQGCMICQCED